MDGLDDFMAFNFVEDEREAQEQSDRARTTGSSEDSDTY